jgi:hypothetical protein
MNKIKRKKKFLKKIINIIVSIIVICFFVFFTNQNIIFKPFLDIKGENKLVVVTRNFINNSSKFSFITRQSILKIPPFSLDKTISSFKLHRKFFLFWTLEIQQKISIRYLIINNQIRAIDEDSNIIDVSINQEEIKKQIPFLLKIEILDQVPKKKKIETSNAKAAKLVEKNEQDLATEIDLYNIYQNDIKPFVEYLYKSESSLGPKISLIQFFPNEGLRFFLYEKIYWFGKNKNYSLLESYIAKSETYLKLKNKIHSYNEFDLRYENRIICRNNE